MELMATSESNIVAASINALAAQLEANAKANADGQSLILAEVKSVSEKVSGHAVTLGKVESFMQERDRLKEAWERWRERHEEQHKLDLKERDKKIEDLTAALNWARGIGAAAAGCLALVEAVLHVARAAGHAP